MSFEADSVERLIDAPAGSGAYVLGDESQNQDLYSKIKLLKAVGADKEDGETSEAIKHVVRSNLRYWEVAIKLVAANDVLRRRYGSTSAGIAKLAKDLQTASEQKAAMKQLEAAVTEEGLVHLARDTKKNQFKYKGQSLVPAQDA